MNILPFHFVSTCTVPYNQLRKMIERKSTDTSLYIYVWFMKTSSSSSSSHTSSSKSLYSKSMKSLLNDHIQQSDPMSEEITRFNALVYNQSDSASKYSSSNKLDHIFNHTCIYKMDKHAQLDRAYDEYKIYKLLQYGETIPSPYHVTPYLRGEQQQNTSIVSQQRYSSALSSLQKSIPYRGIILERCVGSFEDFIKYDHLFDENMILTCDVIDQYVFDWQPTSLNDSSFAISIKQQTTTKSTTPSQILLSMSKSSSSSDTNISKPILFRDFSIATCHRVLTDLRNISSLLQHFHHLCKCVEFLHSKHIIHTDLKLQNIFVRTLDTSSTHVNKIQLILADFDIAIRGKFNNQTNEIDTLSNTIGTYGYHEAVYHDSISFVDACACNTNRFYANYSKQYQQAYTGIDVFSLGIICLTMIYRVRLETHLVFWIKKHLSYQNTFCEENNKDATYKCSPAHVMLYHPTITSKATKHEVIRHKQVLSDVASNIIPKQLCDLLHEMTNVNPESRIKLQQCVEYLKSINCKLN